MRRQILAGLVLALTLVPASLHAAGPTVEKLSSVLSVQDDGTVKIVETIAIDYGSQVMHGFARTLPLSVHFDDGRISPVSLKMLSVTDNGNAIPYTTTASDTSLTMRIQDPTRTVTGKQVFALEYLASGLLHKGDSADQLLWPVTGGWPIEIAHAEATVTFPRNGILGSRCQVGSTLSCPTQVGGSGKSIKFATSGAVTPSTPIVVGVNYTKDMVPRPNDAVESSPWVEHAGSLIVLGFLVVAGIGAAAALHVRRQGAGAIG